MDASNYRRARAIEAKVIRLRYGPNLTPVGLVGFGDATERLDGSRRRRVRDSSSDDRWKLRRSALPVYEESTTLDRCNLDGGCIRGDRTSGRVAGRRGMCSFSSWDRGVRSDVPTTFADQESCSSRCGDSGRHDEYPDDDFPSARMGGAGEPCRNRDHREPGRRVKFGCGEEMIRPIETRSRMEASLRLSPD